MKTINRLKKITKNKSIIEERKNLVHVCNSVANLAEGIPLAGNGNISHSDQRFNIKEAGLKPCFFYVTLSPRRKCELPIPEVTRLRTLSCGKTKVERVRTIANPSLRSLQIFSLRPRKKGNEHSLPFLRGLSSVDVNQIFPMMPIN